MGIFDFLGASLFQVFLKNANLSTLLPPSDPPGPREPHLKVSWSAVPEGSVLIHPPTSATSGMLRILLQSRQNWIDDPDAMSRVMELCEHIVRNFGLRADNINAIAQADTVQITFLAPTPDAQTFPWEFVLAEATRRHQQQMSRLPEQVLLVVRHMPSRGVGGRKAGKRASAPPDAASLSVPEKLLFVKSAPGRLAGTYEFDAEQHLISSSLNIHNEPIALSDPSAEDIGRRIANDQPDIVHLSGIDSVQGADLLGVPPETSPGMYLLAKGHAAVLPYTELAEILIPSSAKRPRLVTFNFYNSSIGAAAVVARGAGAAIGFQDSIDDALAEQFLASFYSEWKHVDWNLSEAFRAALRNIAPQKKARGSGIVLWSATSILEPQPSRGISSTRSSALEEIISANSISDGNACLGVLCKPLKKLNYSLLHNDGDLYSEFTIRRQRPGIYKGITVDVRLAAGVEEASGSPSVYRTTINLDDKNPVEHLPHKVRLALTSRFSRLLEESMFGTISTTVRWGNHVLHDETDRVEMLPVDEWKFDEVSGHWLPSFVFPRDPAVRRIIEAAQRYLIALRDDSAAGFDGYQSFDPIPKTMNERCRAIDAQVQSIWWALLHDFAPSYINPPPSFSVDAQRLRTPSDVIEGKRGTCIDLTLLLASCLEYIDIYPVIFLLNDHAFPGYWRSEGSYQFLTAANLAPVSTPAFPPAAVAAAISDEKPWMLGATQFSGVVELVQNGHIVPIESTLLTSRGGFWDAVDEGSQNLRSKRSFHSMFDLKRARKHVTPVPIWSKGE
jgi:hypothetical protein